MDWLILLVVFAVNAMKDACYATETAFIAHDRPWLASAADLLAMLISGATGLVVAALYVSQGTSVAGYAIVAGALGGACGTRFGSYVSKYIECRFRLPVPHPHRPESWMMRLLGRRG